MIELKQIVMLTLTSLYITAANADNWADKWFDNAVYDTPSSFESQKRGYYTMGGFFCKEPFIYGLSYYHFPTKIKCGVRGH